MKREKSVLGVVHLFLYLLSKNEYFCPTFYEMYKMENKKNKVNKDIVRFLLTYKWTDSYTAYGSKKNPDPRDGLFKYMCVGINKRKEGYMDPKAYDKMTRLQKVLNAPLGLTQAQYSRVSNSASLCPDTGKIIVRVEMRNTEYAIGASIYVRKEYFNKFFEELRQLNN